MTLVQNFFRSVRHALSGLVYAFRHERNFQIEFFIGAVVVAASLLLPLAMWERAVILLLTGVVLSLELLNTAFERVLDLLKPRIHPYVKVVKDVVAGAVLILAVVALTIALMIFLPLFWSVVAPR